MYFGALAMGAELSIAVPILNAMFLEKKPLSFIFKDVKCEFLKRADTDVIFEFADVKTSQQIIEQALKTTERVNHTFKGIAYGKDAPDTVFMNYEITISLKKTR